MSVYASHSPLAITRTETFVTTEWWCSEISLFAAASSIHAVSIGPTVVAWCLNAWLRFESWENLTNYYLRILRLQDHLATESDIKVYFTWQTPNKWITNVVRGTRAYRGVHNGAAVGTSTTRAGAWIAALAISASEVGWALIIGAAFSAARWRFRHHRWST